MDWSKIATQLGYRPARDLREQLAVTPAWYRSRPERWAPPGHAPQALAVPAGA